MPVLLLIEIVVVMLNAPQSPMARYYSKETQKLLKRLYDLLYYHWQNVSSSGFKYRRLPCSTLKFYTDGCGKLESVITAILLCYLHTYLIALPLSTIAALNFNLYFLVTTVFSSQNFDTTTVLKVAQCLLLSEIFPDVFLTDIL